MRVALLLSVIALLSSHAAASIRGENKPVGQATTSEGVTPAEIAPAEITPTESTPAEITPAEITPAEITPAEITPAEITPAEITPAEITPVATTPAGTAPAQVTPGEIRDLDAVVVTGVHPGPSLWKVSSGDRVMWVLATISPLPQDMTWQSAQVETVIAGADQILWSPGFVFSADVGFFNGLTLLPAALRARKNPNGAELQDVLPEVLYARWEVQKDKYLGWEWGIERWRPVFAADKLSREALEQVGLGGGVITPIISAAAERQGLEPTKVNVIRSIEESSDMRALLKDFSRTAINDTECFERTLTRLESGLPVLVARANAWATGDLNTLRALSDGDVNESCMQALLHTDIARQQGYGDLRSEVEQVWLEAAEQALADNQVTLALLPMSAVLDPDGYLAELQARGYRVEAP